MRNTQLGVLLALLLPYSMAQAFQQDFTLDSYNYLTVREKRTSPLDPNNRVLNISKGEFKTELRPDYSAETEDRWKFVARPKLDFGIKQIELQSPSESKTENEFSAKLLEGYISKVFRLWIMTAGIQNYQWGPAELISPSNPFYHFNQDQRHYYYREAGRTIFRGNFQHGSKLLLRDQTVPTPSLFPKRFVDFLDRKNEFVQFHRRRVQYE